MSDIAKMKMEAGLKEVFKPSWYDLLKAQKVAKKRARILKTASSTSDRFKFKEELERKKKKDSRKKDAAAKAARKRNRK